MLDVVRISAIVAVVGIHCLAPAATAERAPWALVVFRSMLNVAVPVFIMISGALNLAPAVLALGISLLVVLGVCGGLGIENKGWGKLVSGNYRSPLNVGASFALVAGLLAVSREWEVSDRVQGVLRRESLVCERCFSAAVS